MAGIAWFANGAIGYYIFVVVVVLFGVEGGACAMAVVCFASFVTWFIRSFLSLQTTPLHLIALQCTAINADCLDLEMGVLLMEDVCLGSVLSSITCEVWRIYCFGQNFNCASFLFLE